MTDFRALCEELVDALKDENTYTIRIELIDRARAALTEQPENDPSQISDGFHTFAELYEHRHALTLSLMKAKSELFWFSRRHNNGELCFGTGDWFIIGAELPAVGSITYHLPMALWESAQRSGATMLKIGRPWDGHTPGDVVERLKAWAALAEQPVGPTDEEIMEMMPQQMRDDLAAAARALARFHQASDLKSRSIHRIILNRHAVDHARAVLARWGQPPEPVAVSERLPGPEDCDEQGRCWLWERDCGYSGCKWALVDRTWSLSQSDEDLSVYTHWLPANALPTPEAQ